MRFAYIAIFLSVTFGWSWGFWALPVLAHRGAAIPSGLPDIVAAGTLAAWGPFVGAVAVALLRGGLRGAWEILRRGLRLRIGWWWWLVVGLTFPALVGGSLFAAWVSGAPIASSEAMRSPVIVPIAFVFILVLGGPLQEEFGWRGTLLDPLQDRLGALGASLAVGTAWAVWHLPLFAFPNDTGPLL